MKNSKNTQNQWGKGEARNKDLVIVTREGNKLRNTDNMNN